LILAEFDIKDGSIVRYQHPSPIPTIKEEVIASYMLTEGGHNRSADCTYFILNRKKGMDLVSEHNKILTDPTGQLMR
jgi:hypothetical protein